MNFPATRQTLIARLAVDGAEEDWDQFLSDYWGSLCGFASRKGRLSATDAEDVTSQVFAILWESDLLSRWHANRKSKLRTLLCGVARRVMENRFRLDAGRKEILAKLIRGFPEGTATWKTDNSIQQDLDTFYAAWAQDILRTSMDYLLARCHREGQGGHFRVLYGRLCEGLAVRRIAEDLGIAVTATENYLKTTKARLRKELELTVAHHVERYTDASDQADQFAKEWNSLSEFLARHGGLKVAVRESYEHLQDDHWVRRDSASFQATKSRMVRRV